MKKSVVLFVYLLLPAALIKAQDKPPKTYRNFPLVVTMQFHSLSFPFKNLKSNFSNAGLGLGTEIALGSEHNWAQQFNMIWYRNKYAGDGLGIYTQSSWRPTIAMNIYTETKIGFGAVYSFRPVESFKQRDGEWVSVGHQGKWMPIIPVGISLGYNKSSTKTYVAPFISYQLMLMGSYNKNAPVMPNTLIQVGTRIHFQK